jgi:hypothetical protein
MPVTLSEYIRRSRSVLDEPSARFWTDAELTDWINDGARDLARRAEDLLTYDQTINVSANIASYPLPVDVIRIHRAEFVPVNSTQTYPIRASSQDEMDQIWGTYQQNPASYPSWFVTKGYPGGSGSSSFQIQFYPVPSQPGTINLYYYKMPKRLASTDTALTIDLPEGWDDLIITYVEWRGLRKTHDARWQDAYKLYTEQIDYLLNTTRFFHDQQQVISTASRMMVPQWLTEWPE